MIDSVTKKKSIKDFAHLAQILSSGGACSDELATDSTTWHCAAVEHSVKA